MDHFTSFAVAIPVKTMSALETCDALWDRFITLFGVPKRLHSDNGGAFTAKVTQALMKKLDSDQTFSTAYHPQSQGKLEKFNGVLCKIIANYVNDNHDDWDKYVKGACLAYNSSVQLSMKVSPFRAFFGRECILPGDNFHNVSFTGHWDDDQYLHYMDQNLELIHKIIKSNQQNANSKNKERVDKKRGLCKYVIGNRVRVRYPDPNPNHSNKFIFNWHGLLKLLKLKVTDWY